MKKILVMPTFSIDVEKGVIVREEGNYFSFLECKAEPEKETLGGAVTRLLIDEGINVAPKDIEEIIPLYVPQTDAETTFLVEVVLAIDGIEFAFKDPFKILPIENLASTLFNPEHYSVLKQSGFFSHAIAFCPPCPL